MAGQDAGDRRRTKQNGGGVELGELDAGLNVGNGQILLAILLGVGLPGVGHAVLVRLVDGADRIVGLLDNLAGLAGVGVVARRVAALPAAIGTFSQVSLQTAWCAV